MKRPLTYIIIFLLVFIIGLNSFTDEKSYFGITQKDVEVKIPDGFGYLFYDPRKNKITPEGFVLGRKLFYDPILSKDSSISCGFCHRQSAAFSSPGQTLAHGIDSLIGRRNVPTLVNLVFQNYFMIDGSVSHLDRQPIAPITNPVEMNESLDHVVKKLKRNKEYVNLFQLAFNDTIINSERMLKALTEFTSTLLSTNTRYDKFSRNEIKLTEQELRGFKLYRMHCHVCHQEPLFTDNTFRNIGIKPDPELKDSGRMAVTGLASDYMKFKVPSLRNVTLTAPYMHDGRFKTLKEVLDHYANGDFYTDNYDVRVTEIKGLTESEKGAIITFLGTLTDSAFIMDPRFADPNLK